MSVQSHAASVCETDELQRTSLGLVRYCHVASAAISCGVAASDATRAVAYLSGARLRCESGETYQNDAPAS